MRGIVGVAALAVIAAASLSGALPRTAPPSTVSAAHQLAGESYRAAFDRAGMHFTPLAGGPAWHWRLTRIGTSDGGALAAVSAAAPRSSEAGVSYARGPLVERYTARPKSVEQEFVISRALPLGGADLVLTGAIESNRTFVAQDGRWAWLAPTGAVTLGDVTVFDARGRVLPARMDVSATSTRIVVDGAALRRADYPVTIDPEVGANDFRISDIGPNGAVGHEALESKVAYNSATAQYLVVWRGDEQADLQAEIHGQLVDAATGAEVGTNDFLIARIGTAGDPATDAIQPAVAYNSVRNEFLVVFAGDNAPDPPPLIVDTFEIYAQRVAANGSLVGGPLRLSDMGSDDANGSFDASDPAIAYNPGSDQYLVAWAGDDNTAPLVNNELEIFGQLVGFSGSNLVEVGTNDFQISTMGTDGNGAFDAREPSVAYNSAASEYLVVWSGNDAEAQPTGAFEIFGQRLTTAGSTVGTDDFLLGNAGDEAYTPDVAHNTTDNEYLVVWEGDDGAGNDFEVYGQLLNGTAGEIGADFQISDAGTSAAQLAQTPAVAYGSGVNEYLVVWKGEDDFGGLVDGEFEAFGKRLTAAGATTEGTLRLSNMGPNGVANSSLQTPDVAYSDSGRNVYLTVWAAENQPTTAANEAEIWGQLVGLRSDLQITKSASPSNPGPGDTVTYTITYVNAGPDPALNVVITDLVPAAVTSPSFTTSGVTGSAPVLRPGTTFIWDVARINSGQGGTLTITGQVSGSLSGGTVVGNTASVATTTIISDPNTANNSQTANFTVRTPPPKITVTKIVDAGSATPDQWCFNISPNPNNETLPKCPAPGTDTVTFLSLAPGSYTISETSLSGYVFASGTGTNCTFTGSTATASVTDGVDASCVFHNTTNPEVRIDKRTNGSDGVVIPVGSPVTWTYLVSNTGNVTLTSVTVVDDDGTPANTADDFHPTCPKATLAAGESMTCTASGTAVAGHYVNTGTATGSPTTGNPVTDTDESDYFSTPRLIVIKHVINNNGGNEAAADFTLDSGGTNDTPDNFAGSELGTTVTLAAGSYNVTETGPSGYSASFSADCSGTIANGQTKTCTVTNDDQPGTLIVRKVVSGSTKPCAEFAFSVNGGATTPFEADCQNDLTVNAGTYSITEPAVVGFITEYSNCSSVVVPNGGSMTCTVTNTGRRPPTAVADSYATNEDTPLNVAAPGVLGNDSDPDAGDTITAVLVSGPGNAASFTLNSDGSFTYTPTANFNGGDSFSYKARDSLGDESAPVTVSITVAPVNDAPSVLVAAGGSCSSSAVAGTMNLTVGDIEGDAVALTVASSNTPVVPTSGIVLGGSGGSRTVTITPASKARGSATVTLIATDASGGSSATTITVIVGTERKDTLNGTTGADLILGISGSDTINGNAGNDLICDGNGNGVLNGGAGDDTIVGANGDDRLAGGDGNDGLFGGGGRDQLQGQNGDDTLVGGMGADSYSGGPGTDTAIGFNPAEGDTTDGT